MLIPDLDARSRSSAFVVVEHHARGYKLKAPEYGLIDDCQPLARRNRESSIFIVECGGNKMSIRGLKIGDSLEVLKTVTNRVGTHPSRLAHE